MVCKVALSAVNIIGTPSQASAAASARSIKTALDGDGVLSEYDDISFLMYTDKEVTKGLTYSFIHDLMLINGRSPKLFPSWKRRNWRQCLQRDLNMQRRSKQQ